MGYKGHIAIDPDSELVTATAVTPGNAGDAAVAPELLAAELEPGDTPDSDEPPIVCADAAYGSGELLETLEAAGAELRFLPPYSPDFNPIEFTFSKLKALLRAAAERTRDALWDTVATAIEAITPIECANMFTAAGYEPE